MFFSDRLLMLRMTVRSDRLHLMSQAFQYLTQYINHVDSIGGVSKLDAQYEHAICACINRLGDIALKVRL